MLGSTSADTAAGIGPPQSLSTGFGPNLGSIAFILAFRSAREYVMSADTATWLMNNITRQIQDRFRLFMVVSPRGNSSRAHVGIVYVYSDGVGGGISGCVPGNRA